MSDILLTITQSLQLVALTPCIFVIAFLLITSRRDGTNILPTLYFLSLASGFVLNLIDVFSDSIIIKGTLMLCASTLAALSFLMVLQFTKGRIPHIMYWLILLVPLVGGSPFVYISFLSREVCLDAKYCFVTSDLRSLYEVISSLTIFLFLIVLFVRNIASMATTEADYKHKYWMVISIIGLNLFLLAVALLTINEKIDEQDALFISSIIRIGFIYLVLTSIFRLFYDVFNVNVIGVKSKATYSPENDKRVVEELKTMFDKENIFREMNLSREIIAKKLGISEQQVSRIVNTYFNKNLNELINERRISEAKERLKTEDTQVTVIAFEVGFSSIASFNRVFKETTGASPSAYRAFHKNSAR